MDGRQGKEKVWNGERELGRERKERVAGEEGVMRREQRLIDRFTG